MAAADLAEIKRLDPTYAPASHLSELPFARRFAALRDLGLSVTEALAAVTPRFSPHDTRSHLRIASPGGAQGPTGLLSREELKAAKELFSAARAGNPAAEETIFQFAKDFATGLVTLANVLRPEVFVIGGGMAKDADLFLPYVNETLKNEVFGWDHAPVKAVMATLGNDAGIIGASLL